MPSILNSIQRIESLEKCAESKNNLPAKLHPTSKILLVFIYIIAVVSCKRTDILPLIMLSIIPIICYSLIDISAKEVLVRIAIALPFAFFATIFNIFIDHEPLVIIGGVSVSGGLLSFLTAMIKTVVTVSSVILLSATTTITDITMSLKKMFVPQILITQILLLYRYLLLLCNETFNISTAATLRSGERKWLKMKDMGVVVGTLLLKAISRAEKAHYAMVLRGFQGYYKYEDKQKFRFTDATIIMIVLAVIIVCRFSAASEMIGRGFV